MPKSVIQKVEKLAERDKVELGKNFIDRNKEIYDWKNEEYTIDEDTTVQEVAPYPEIAAEFPGIEVEWEGSTLILDADMGTYENKEAANLERNCDLGELPRQNNMS